MRMLFNLKILLLGFYCKDIFSQVLKDVFRRMFVVVLFIIWKTEGRFRKVIARPHHELWFGHYKEWHKDYVSWDRKLLDLLLMERCGPWPGVCGAGPLHTWYVGGWCVQGCHWSVRVVAWVLGVWVIVYALFIFFCIVWIFSFNMIFL